MHTRQRRIGWPALLLIVAAAPIAFGDDDCNADGVDDAYQIAAGLLPDCDANGVADICEGGDPIAGWALDFDEAGDHVAFDPTAALRIRGDLTIEAWIRPTALGLSNVILDHAGPTIDQEDNTMYRVSIKNDGDIEVAHRRDVGFLAAARWDTNLPVDTWYHIAIVRNDMDGTYVLYVDGEFIALKTYSFPPNGGENGRLVFGVGADLSAFPFRGLIDEVRIWSDVRTEAEIQANLYRRQVTPAAHLVGYWRLDEGVGSTVRDEMSGLHGVAAATMTWVPTGLCGPSEAPTPCPGDVNGDAMVNFADLDILLDRWGTDCTQP